MVVSLKLASSVLLFESLFILLLKMQMKHMVYSVTLVCDRLNCCRFWEKQLKQFRNCLVTALSSVTRGFINHVIVCCKCFVYMYCILCHVFLLPRRYFLLKRRSWTNHSVTLSSFVASLQQRYILLPHGEFTVFEWTKREVYGMASQTRTSQGCLLSVQHKKRWHSQRKSFSSLPCWR